MWCLAEDDTGVSQAGPYSLQNRPNTLTEFAAKLQHNMPDNIREIIGWLLAFAGLACAIIAAYIKAGTFEALTAASAGLTTLSATWGYLNKTPAK